MSLPAKPLMLRKSAWFGGLLEERGAAATLLPEGAAFTDSARLAPRPRRCQ